MKYVMYEMGAEVVTPGPNSHGDIWVRVYYMTTAMVINTRVTSMKLWVSNGWTEIATLWYGNDLQIGLSL